jgi:hypothetical protein
MDRLRDLLTAAQSQGLAGLLREPRGLFALGAVALLIVYGLSVGKTRALLSLLAIYVAYTLALLFPFKSIFVSRIPEAWQMYATAGLFVALYVIVFFILSHTLRKSRVAMGEISVVAVVLISVVQLGLLAALLASLVPADEAERAAGGLRRFLTGRYALWAWAAGSLLILPFVRARGRHS